MARKEFHRDSLFSRAATKTGQQTVSTEMKAVKCVAWGKSYCSRREQLFLVFRQFLALVLSLDNVSHRFQRQRKISAHQFL